MKTSLFEISFILVQLLFLVLFLTNTSNADIVRFLKSLILISWYTAVNAQFRKNNQRSHLENKIVQFSISK